MTNNDNLFSRLSHIPKFGNGVGLHRVRWLLSDFASGPWFSTLKTIRVTGSNGKGSVCAMLAAIMSAAGLDCGLYTSPHLLRFNERIVLNQHPIPDEELAASIEWLLQKEEEYTRLHPADTLGAFEAFTALAMRYYAQHQPQVIVAEAGIGGRYDSTRVLPGNLVGLVSLDLEHTELLGNSLEMIAYDKADLCPDGGTLVVGEIAPDVLRRLRSYCDLRKIQLVSVVDVTRAENISFGPEFMSIDLEVEDLRFDRLKLRLQGYHQINNAAVAILLARRWLAQEMPAIPQAQFVQAVYSAMSAVRWPGRFERISQEPDVYIDVGHTPDGIDQLRRTVEKALAGRKILLVIGVSYNKKVTEIVSRLAQLADVIVCTRAYHKGSPVVDIASAAQAANPKSVIHQAETIEEAAQLARQIATEQGLTVLVTGGIFLAIEFAQAFQGNDPQALQFF